MITHPDGGVYVGVMGGGVFRSTDDGLSWFSTSLTGSDVVALSITQTGSILAATTSEIFSTSDNGRTWIPIYEAPDPTVRIMTATVNSRGDLFASVDPVGIVRSTDRGVTWTLQNTGLLTPIVYSLMSDRDDRVYAGTGSGLYRSTDNGESWMQTGSGDFLFGWITSLAMDPSSGFLFAGTMADGLYRSTDQGVWWDRCDSGLVGRNACLSVTVGSHGTVFVGRNSEPDRDAGGIFASSDGGTSWFSLGSGLASVGIGAVATTSETVVLAAALSGASTRPGILRSVDYGKSWSESNDGLTATFATCLMATAEGGIFAGTDGWGMYRTNDDGRTWHRLNPGIGRNSVRAFARTDDQSIIAVTSGNEISRSTDNGDSWDVVHEFQTTLYALTATPAGKLLAGDDLGVLSSTDGGKNWIRTSSFQGPVFCITVLDEPCILTGGDAGRVLKSTDDGATWEGLARAGSGAVNLLVRGKDRSLYAATTDGVFESLDAGITWQSRNVGLTNRSVSSLVIDPDGNIYAGTSRGVFASTDAGSTWSPRNARLPNLSVTSMVLSPRGHLFAATAGNSIARSVHTVSDILHDWSPPWKTFSLDQNYPNPFNAQTVITYSLAVEGEVSASVFDATGREVTTLVSSRQYPGQYRLVWNADGFSSGIYYLRLRAKGLTDTKKLMLTR